MIKKEIKNILCPVIVSTIPNFYRVKHKILSLINSTQDALSENNPIVELDIERSDWHINEEPERQWLKEIYPIIHDNILETCQTMGFNSYNIIQAWFQQYSEQGSHGWHIHAGNFSGVVYLDLPQGAPVTLFCDPITKQTFKPDASEGDIVIFPSFLLHKSAPNFSKHLKTIISFNLNVGYPDDFYGREINQ